MTGTSLDGIDVAVCRVTAGQPRLVALLASETLPLAADLRARLLTTGWPMWRSWRASAGTLGRVYAEAVVGLAAREALRVELVGSHGQTVYHEHGVATLQLGEAAQLALPLGCPVVRFSANDIAVGGCGAPLVPDVD